MKKIILILVISILLSTTTLNISAKEEVNKNTLKLNQVGLTSAGGILYVGGSGPGNYTTIQDAVDNASDDDTVFVYSDTYYENVVIEKSITLKGEDKNTTIIHAKDEYHTIRIKKAGVTITEFTITNEDSSYAGINSNANYNHIYNNIITNNWYGIEFWYSSNSNIHDCEISNNENTGIIMWNSHYNTISRNDIISNNRGFDLLYSSHNTISENLLDGNYNALALCWGKPSGDSASYNAVKENTITNNWIGIFCKGHADGKVSYNVITENYVAHNKGEPGAGIVLGTYTSNNKVYRNVLIDNMDTELNQINNGYDHGNNNLWYHEEQGNYWSDYKEKYPRARPKIWMPWIWNKPYEIPGSAENEDKYPFVNSNLETFNILPGQSSQNTNILSRNMCTSFTLQSLPSFFNIRYYNFFTT